MTTSSQIFVLRRFYAERSEAPAWFDAAGLSHDGQVAIDAMAAAARDGLDPLQYGTMSIFRQRQPYDAGAIARRDIVLSSKVLRYASDLYSGHSDWKHLDRDVDLPGKTLDP